MFGKNIFDEEYRTYVFNLTDFFGSLQQASGRESWWGISARVSF